MSRGPAGYDHSQQHLTDVQTRRIVARAGDGYAAFRLYLVRALLLGLEVLVAADVIRTVAVSPTLNSVAVLAAIVAIRTFLSWSLILELEGRWPWQKSVAPPA